MRQSADWTSRGAATQMQRYIAPPEHSEHTVTMVDPGKIYYLIS